MKKLRIILLLCLIMLGLTACGRPASANKLVRMAKKEHGSAKVVSKVKNTYGKGYTVTLYDKLQDFDYTVSSYMAYTDICGFTYSHPETTDDFRCCLVNKVAADEQAEIENIKLKYDANVYFETSPSVYVCAKDYDSAKQAAREVAELFQRNNKNYRLDFLNVHALTTGSGSYDISQYVLDSEAVIGYMPIPEMIWVGKDQTIVDIYVNHAKDFDPDAVYLRRETVRFGDTRFTLSQVTEASGAPTSDDSPVTLYYFRASDGGEFFLADFCINDVYNPGKYITANNYDNRKYPDEK